MNDVEISILITSILITSLIPYDNDYLDITVGWIGDNLKHQLSPFLEDITQDFLLIQLIVIFKPWSCAFFLLFFNLLVSNYYSLCSPNNWPLAVTSFLEGCWLAIGKAILILSTSKQVAVEVQVKWLGN